MIMKISNELLLDTYIEAKALRLDSHFILLLETEMRRRNILKIKHLKNNVYVSPESEKSRIGK